MPYKDRHLHGKEQECIFNAKIHLNNLEALINGKTIEQKDFENIKSQSEPKFENKKITHRETQKKSLEANDLENYICSLEAVKKSVKKALEKVKAEVELPTYSKVEPVSGMMILELDPSKIVGEKSDIDLYRINLNPETNMLAFSNIIIFNDRNKTLPVGMDYSSEILVNLDGAMLKNKREKENYIISLTDNSEKIISNKINITEYDI